ncbi:unnamed protein product [Adineta ricciae]|uniref:Uncharacterized protein n=1 Tax=Adineta ricciae TaxID=249248 RepID=A0A816B754_ADIRI|nr:unnamed protein product [Adineta ricciae]CAF1605124.1 unnamed protein product [Adineta ricciae]
MKALQWNIPILYRLGLFILQCALLIIISHIKDILISVQQTTVIVVPTQFCRLIDQVDRSFYWVQLISAQLCISLTNSLLLDSMSSFPFGWLMGAIITLLIDHFCWFVADRYPRLFQKPVTVRAQYQYLSDNRRLVLGIFSISCTALGLAGFTMICTLPA